MQKIKSQKGSVTLIVIITMLFLITFLMATYVMISNKAQTSEEITAQIKEQYNNLEEEGSVNENSIGGNVIPIYTKEQLVQMGNGQEIYIEEENKYYTYTNNGYYILKNNIDVNEGKYTFNDNNEIIFNNDAEQWTPFTTAFTGTLDGLMHNIYGLYIEDSNGQYKGLFSVINKNATIKNLGIENSYISVYQYAGSFAGQNNGKIENCYNNGIIIGKNYYIGGIAGSNCSGATIKYSSNKGKIINLSGGSTYSETGGISGANSGNIIYSYNNGLVINENEFETGGIVGANGSTGIINYCYNNGIIIAEKNEVGGIAGINVGIISNSYNNSNIEISVNYCGGICGTNSKIVENCFNKGNITNMMNTGGITGANSGTLTLCYNSGNVTGNNIQTGGIVARNTGMVEKCYNEGYILGKNYAVGGIIGDNQGTITQCFNLGTVYSRVYCIGGIVGQNSSTVTCCYNIGKIEDNGGKKKGSIVGYNASTTKIPTVSNCYNIGIVQGTSPVGIIIGENGESSIVTNCYYLNTLTLNLIGTDNSQAGNTSACAVKTELEMKATDGSFIGLLNTNISPAIWKEDTNNINSGYPIFTWQEANFSN